MPRAKRSAAESSVPARRSSRTPARPEPESVKKTRGASSSSDASPVKAPRKASPSPAPTSRSKAAKSASPKVEEKSPTEKGQGDEASRPGRVTRAVIKEKEEATTRGRSSTRKTDKPKEEATPTRSSRSRSSTTPKKTAPKKKKTPKGGKGRSSARGKVQKEEEEDEEEEEEAEEEGEEEEAEEEEEEPPKKAAKSTPKGKAKTPAKTSTTPKTTPKPAASRSRSRGGKDEVTSPQVVLEKMDASDLGTPEKKSEETKAENEVTSPRGRRGKKEVAKATPPPRTSRSRRGVQKDEESSEEVKEETAEDDKESSEIKDQEADKAEDTPDIAPEKSEESKEVEEETKAVNDKEEEMDSVEEEEKVTAEESEEKPKEEESAECDNSVDDEEPKPEADSEKDEEKEKTAAPVSEQIGDAVEISDEDTASSLVVEPALSEAVQISDDSQSVPADDEQEEPVVVSVQSEPIQIEDETSVQNSVSSEPEVMEVQDGEICLDGEQNGQTECRKRKHDDEEEQDCGAKRACVTEEPVQENGETSQTSEEDCGKESTTSYLDDVTKHTVEEDYVMVNISDVPDSNSKEVLDILPQEATEQSVKSNSDSKLGPLYNRKFIPNPSFQSEGSDPTKQFTVASYNILAQCHLEKNDYSFTPSEYLTLPYRHQKMMTEFQYLDADVVCLQEVGPSYYETTLAPAMKSLGYSGIMKKRVDDYYDEGEATFWKDSRFTLVKSETHVVARLADKEVEDAGLEDNVKTAVLKYLDMPDVLILTQLKCNFTHNIVTVGNIHVQWGKMEVPDIQCIQIACAIKALVNLAGSDTNPHVLCGDFNSESTSPGYQLVLDGYLSDSMIDKLQCLENLELSDGSKKALFNQLYRAFQHPSSNIKSSYLIAQGKEPTVTSFNRVMRAAVDYIFYSSNSLDNRGVLEVAAESVITETGGIPDATFPSDHVSIKSTLSFK